MADPVGVFVPGHLFLDIHSQTLVPPDFCSPADFFSVGDFVPQQTFVPQVLFLDICGLIASDRT